MRMTNSKKVKSTNTKGIKFLFPFIIGVLLAVVGIGLYFIQSGKLVYISQKNTTKTHHTPLKKQDKILKNTSKNNLLQENNNSFVAENSFMIIKNNEEPLLNEEPLVEKESSSKTISRKPKLAIIIDDVSFRSQARKIQGLPYKVTPSFLPPTKSHPDTPSLAKNFSVYMVHLPLEAFEHARPETRTLKKGESFASVDRWISFIKSKFPRASYYNNHTGSKFTSDKDSMDKLFRALKKRHIRFLDSKTTSKSKAKMMSRKYNVKMLKRDVFLDNIQESGYIKKQILQAISVAKKRGSAIAICHPKKVTLQTLKNAKHMFKDVQLVYINEI